MSFVRLKPGDAGLPQNNSGHTRTTIIAAVHAALIMVRVFASRFKTGKARIAPAQERGCEPPHPRTKVRCRSDAPYESVRAAPFRRWLCRSWRYVNRFIKLPRRATVRDVSRCVRRRVLKGGRSVRFGFLTGRREPQASGGRHVESFNRIAI